MAPTDNELKLLRHLWRHERLSAREIHDLSVADTQWSFSATRKTLERMTDKGLIRPGSVHGIKVFSAAQGKLETVAALATAFARDVLDCETPLPAAAFASSRLISPEEIEALETLLNRLSEGDPS